MAGISDEFASHTTTAELLARWDRLGRRWLGGMLSQPGMLPMGSPCAACGAEWEPADPGWVQHHRPDCRYIATLKEGTHQ